MPLSLLFYITVCYDYDSTLVLAVRVPASRCDSRGTGTGGQGVNSSGVLQVAGNLQVYLKQCLPYYTGGRGSILRITGTTTQK